MSLTDHHKYLYLDALLLKYKNGFEICMYHPKYLEIGSFSLIYLSVKKHTKETKKKLIKGVADIR